MSTSMNDFFKKYKENSQGVQQVVEPVQQPVQEQVTQPVQQQVAQPVQQPIQQPVQQSQMVQQPAMSNVNNYAGVMPTFANQNSGYTIPKPKNIEVPVNVGQPSRELNQINDNFREGMSLCDTEHTEVVRRMLNVSNDVDVSVVQLASISVTPLAVPTIIDKYGKIAEKIRRVEEQTGLSAVPLKLAGVNSKVAQIMNYQIVTFNGIKVCLATDHATHTDAELRSISMALMESYGNGEEITYSLLRDYDLSSYGLGTVSLPAFNTYDVSVICGYLQGIGARPVCLSTGEYMIVSGVC